MAKIEVGIGEASIKGVGIIGHEIFSVGECSDLADMLEGFNAPGNAGTPLRRLTDLLWSLQNDTEVWIISTKEDADAQQG